MGAKWRALDKIAVRQRSADEKRWAGANGSGKLQQFLGSGRGPAITCTSAL
jgi:hypothetical protein